MSDIKEVDIQLRNGVLTSPPGQHISIKLVTGASEANKVWSELQGRYGEDFDNKPVLVVGSEDAEALKDLVENIENTIDDADKKEEFLQAKQNILKPSVKRIGDEVIITREDPADELAPFIGGFQDVLDGNVSIDIEIRGNKSVQHIVENKHNLLYIMSNGGAMDFKIRMSLAFLERCFDMGTQFAPVPEPETAKSMLNLFKKYTLNFETFDVDDLPNDFKAIFEHPLINEVCCPFKEELVQKAKADLLPFLERIKTCENISGPIKFYFPVKDTLALTIEANVPEWFSTVFEFLNSA
jgi:hypothetical protein